MMKTDFAFGKMNFILVGVSVVIIIIGFVLMSGGASVDGVSYNPEIFSTRRIVVAPIVCMIGFCMMVVAILTNSKEKKTEE
ncbi:putative membrane protein [Parabacteroides sp. PF5-5]|uniref:DUF3098 domain-containing protein n=1 Tax=unclassified Parabacteroides TaxID=2649774 RepID=UPI002473963B|nr:MULTISPECIES: DUF3098 domain-containing protein [unclassified Parabacteroides]MDH6306628.1 putative membrane protein [Parabacteroides sp. PH5-39]MDH6317595.1 putative membrane protein [Parabacteroides sp. PF5-13]MDH6321339.1 putative membrane protein [Parabacteroides sp. PH5-13]MDH6325096.1 putative membrane protein [Parabacteroides sp. PH5-8]MDH6328805.1 putative membrane protein [Parabacteroides sp. PH5-41]